MVKYVWKSSLYKRVINKLSRIIQLASLRKNQYHELNDLEFIFEKNRLKTEKTITIALDVGSGPEPKNPFNATKIFGADLRVNESLNVIYADLSLGTLPFESETFDYVTAHDLLEHILRVAIIDGKTTFPFITLVNEVHRVLKKGGIFYSITPCYPAKEAFQDPTHVNILTEDTLEKYFCKDKWASIYGFNGDFSLKDDGWFGNKYFAFLLKN